MNVTDILLWQKMQAVIAENKTNNHLINYDTLTNIFFPWTSFRGSTVLPNGKLLCIPYNFPYFIIIEPDDLSKYYIFGDADNTTTKYYGSCLLSSNKVIISSYNYNPSTVIDLDTFQISNIGDISPLNNGWAGFLQSMDGKLVHLPNYNTNAELYDATTLELIKTFNMGNRYNNGCLLPSNKIVGVPATTTYFSMYDFTNDVVSQYNIPGLPQYAYAGGVLLADERVLFVPRTSPRIRIFDSISETITAVGPTDSAADKYFGGCLLPDGRVLFVPGTKPQIGIFNPDDNTLINVGPSRVQNQKYFGCSLMPTGQVVLMPWNAPYITILSASDGNYGTLPDLETCCSAYLNIV